LAAYRVVQESLTNVVRHAAASRAEVTVTHGDDEVVVEVTDDGRGAAVDEGLESASGRQPADSDRRSRRSGRARQSPIRTRGGARAPGGRAGQGRGGRAGAAPGRGRQPGGGPPSRRRLPRPGQPAGGRPVIPEG